MNGMAMQEPGVAVDNNLKNFRYIQHPHSEVSGLNHPITSLVTEPLSGREFGCDF